MPHFGVPHFEVRCWGSLFLLHFSGLEPDFRADTEVRDNVQDDLFKHRVFGKLLEYVSLRVELIRVHWREVHNISYVEVVDPVVVVFDSEGIAHVDLVSLALFELHDLANALEFSFHLSVFSSLYD